jgi:hypothetical protein
VEFCRHGFRKWLIDKQYLLHRKELDEMIEQIFS